MVDEVCMHGCETGGKSGKAVEMVDAVVVSDVKGVLEAVTVEENFGDLGTA